MKPDTTKYKKIVLGAEATPLPVWDPQLGTTGALAGPNSGITLHTTREDVNGIPAAEYIYAELMRNLPSRSMLPHLMHELMERDPNRVDWDKHSFLCGYIGPPSIGKSYMIKTLDRLAHPKGCLYLNCKDIDMGTIFVETVFDTNGANREKASIDAKILQGNQGGKGLSAESLTMLRHGLGEAFVEEKRGDKMLISIDWNGIQVKGNTPEEQNYQKQVIRETISQVCQAEGIVMTSELGQIGITTRDGIAIRAADPKSADYGRPVLLDEINRAKPGTLQKLYEFFAMLSDPKVDRFQVTGGENRPFTFRREDLPVSYRMNFTGNPSTRGMGSGDMDRPLISRFGVELDIRTVPDPALHDYADRIAQTLTGVPLTQIFYAGRPYFEQHPEKLAEVALSFRLAGLTEEQKKNVPEEELLNIRQGIKIIQLSEQLAEFFSALKSVFNPESQMYRGGSFSLSQEYESYLQGVEIDLRLVSKIIEKASVVTPKVLQPDVIDFGSAFSTSADKTKSTGIDMEDRLADRGKRLEDYLQQWMHQVLVPADAQTRNIKPEECQKVLRLARTLAAHCGIGDLKLKESQRGGIIRIAKLYNFDKFDDPNEQHKLLRDLMVEAVRKNHEELRAKDPTLQPLPASADDIITVADVQKAVKVAAALAPAHGVLAAGVDTLNFATNPFVAVATSEQPGAPDNLVSRDAFLTALAIPELRQKSVAGLWDKALLELAHIEPTDEGAKIAANASASGFAVTTVTVSNAGKEETLHILRAAPTDEKAESLVVVSGRLDKRLQSLLKSGGVTYVDYNDIDSARAVNAVIDERLADNPAQDKVRRSLSAAFLMRNGAPGEEAAYADKSPGELLTNMKSLTPSAPLRITSSPAPKPKAPGV